MEAFVPHYFQAALELGSPRPWTARLGGLVRHRLDVGASLVPRRLRPGRRTDTTAQVDSFVRTSAERIEFLYGARDPWSAEPIDCGPSGASRGCRVHVARGVGHDASWAHPGAGARTRFVNRVRNWAGVGDDPARPVTTD